MANTMTIDQVSTVLRDVLAQATGRTDLAALNTDELLTIGQRQIQTGTDPVMRAISQMVSRTIFSNRPYVRKFRNLARSETEWGNLVRKITILETPNDLSNNPYIDLVDGEAIDQYKVSKPKALELHFCGQQTYEVDMTIFDNQLNVAFNSAEEFGAFISAVFTYVFNKIEKIHEETARATVCGFIGGKIAANNNVVHMVTEYNNLTGLELDGETIYQSEHFGDFMKWAYSRIEEVSNLLTEYSTVYHTNINEGDIMRHTPEEMQLAFFYAPIFYQCKNRVLADTYHNDFAKLPGAEMVNYWQSIKTPDTINLASPEYLGADGNRAVGEALTQSGVFGVICDLEAMGYSPILTRTKTTPYNAKGEYYNIFWKFNERNWLDFTENGVVFLLD